MIDYSISQGLIAGGAKGFTPGFALIEHQEAELRTTLSDPLLREHCFGYEAAECFASPEGSSSGRRCSYQETASFPPNRWALTGEWTLQRRSILLHAAYGRIIFRFHGTDVYLAMQSGPACYSRFRVLLDGEIPACSHGADVDSHGYGVVSRRRMYQLVRQTMRASSDGTLEIQFFDPGVEVYSFAAG